MEKVANINDLYFIQKKTPTEIANITNVSISYVSRILKQNSKYASEKEKRKLENLKNRRKIQKDLIYAKRKNKIDFSYFNMKNQHNQAVEELSKKSVIGKEALRKWCSSAYKYNKEKNRFEFDTDNISKPADFPLYIKV